jgi:murein DD-endopeptidase MepM/ murein hydrolase activator NlpD
MFRSHFARRHLGPTLMVLGTACLELKETADARADSVAAARVADSIRLDSAAAAVRGDRKAAPAATAPMPGVELPPPALGTDPLIALDSTPSESNPRPTTSELLTLRAALQSPLPGVDLSKLTSNFDEARGAGGARRHDALDILAPRGTPIRSASSGRLLRMFTSKAGGLMVYASDSTERFILMYAHLDGYAPGVHEGMRLERGHVLGYVGTTGNAPPNTPHLHFAIARVGDVKRWWDGTPVDPLPLLR